VRKALPTGHLWVRHRPGAHLPGAKPYRVPWTTAALTCRSGCACSEPWTS